MCVCAGVRGQGKREGPEGEGHNALGEGDEICGVRGGESVKGQNVFGSCRS